MNDDTKLIKIREAAELLGINPETLRRWDNEDRLKAVRIGKRKDRRYKLSDIKKLMDSTNKP